MNMRGFRYRLLIILVGILISAGAFAQGARALIDSERASLSMTDAKTLEKARSFILRDSTYYVGHMYYGGYLFFRADDKLGFTKAIEPLKKALHLLEKDFDRELRVRSNSYQVYSKVFRYQSDYGFISNLLESCYQNVEMPDKAFAVLNRVREYNFQLEQNVTSYNTMAWIFHRNRVYTSKQFPFLKNSVKENVATANKYLDSALMKIQNDMPLNVGLFDPNYLNRQYLGTFHYKAMIYDYKLEVDSADYFYSQLIRYNAYSPNNFAEFKLASAQLGTADEYFKEAEKGEDPAEKRTKEYYYMRGTLDIYRGHPEAADSLLKRVLDQQGSSPGYGWHSIGLARALHYEGLTKESQDRADKASRFQELHIGTTWGQEQYNLAVAGLNYINAINFKRTYFFENDEWWFWLNPVNWYEWLRFSLEIHHYKMVLASLIAENPERAQVLYSIFSSENLLSFDEVWSSLEGFGNEYFINMYEKMLVTDKRPKVKKYFRYFLGKLYLAEGNKDLATNYFTNVIRERDPESQYNKLLYARAFEGLAEASPTKKARKGFTVQFYETFPQLVPFSKLTMPFQLQPSGQTEGAMAKDILADLEKCKIDFTTDSDAPKVLLHFSEVKNALDINYVIYGVNTSKVIAQGTLRVNKDDAADGGKLLAWHLFNVQKKKVEDKPEVKEIKSVPKPAV
jgi:hypothetical protein